MFNECYKQHSISKDDAKTLWYQLIDFFRKRKSAYIKSLKKQALKKFEFILDNFFYKYSTKYLFLFFKLNKKFNELKNIYYFISLTLFLELIFDICDLLASF